MNFNMSPFPNNLFMMNPNMVNMNNNNFFNPNLMNNQFQIMQMNQLNQMFQMNPLMMQNMNIQNFNNNILINPNQKHLVDKIINFYQKQEKSYMNYNEPYQIKQLLNNLDISCPLLKEGNDIADPLSYIKEKKKLIKFINHDFKIFNVKVPISIDKKTLYSIARLYKGGYYSDILLIYMNCILFKDESPIDSIGDGDYVIIIESEYYLDDTYFNSLINKNNNKKKINLMLETPKGRRNIIIPSDTKLSEIYKALILHFGYDYYFIYKDKKITEKDERVIENGKTVLAYQSNVYNYLSILTILGKEIFLNIKSKDERGNYGRIVFQNFPVGLLNSVKQLLNYIEVQTNYKIKNLFLGGKEINLEENESFGSLGIKGDTNCTIIYYNK